MNLVAMTDYSNQLIESLCDNLAVDVYKWTAFPEIIMDCYAKYLSTMQVRDKSRDRNTSSEIYYNHRESEK